MPRALIRPPCSSGMQRTAPPRAGLGEAALSAALCLFFFLSSGIHSAALDQPCVTFGAAYQASSSKLLSKERLQQFEVDLAQYLDFDWLGESMNLTGLTVTQVFPYYSGPYLFPWINVTVSFQDEGERRTPGTG